MESYVAELIGTLILVLLGNGVVANVVLQQTTGHDAGWITITAGWGFAVYTAVLCVGEVSGAHINPAVTIGLATAGEFEWNLVPGYIIAQMIGGIMGAALVYVVYKSHFDVTAEPDVKRAAFCNTPKIRNLPLNLFTEVVATFVLVFAVLNFTDPSFQLPNREPTPVGLGSIGALRVGFIVFAIGMSLGGPTGYAINPARDLGPRIAHALLPIAGKGSNDWGYAGIPVLGPIVGGVLAAYLYLAL